MQPSSGLRPNPVLKRLGFADTDRVAIIHTDDIGMCQASVTAFADLHAFGLISSGAVMVPCPWFLEAARYAREHPEADLGAHLTLTCEYTAYRWGPISTREPASGLMDEQGFMHRTSRAVREHARPEAVQKEIEVQVARAAAAGMTLTHADTHMGSLGADRFMLGYVKMGLLNRLPMMLFRMSEAQWRARGLDAPSAEAAVRYMSLLEGLGVPLMDRIEGMPLERPDDQLNTAKALFDGLPAGVTHFILHPSVDTPELRAIAPDWRARVGNYHTFLSEDLREHLRRTGVQVIGYRELQQLMPDPTDLAPLLENLTAL